MGQYHFVVNLDKREFLHPHRCGDGLKLLEFGSSGEGTMMYLAVLLHCSIDRGGGDLHRPEDPALAYLYDRVCGRWAGDRIIVVGDYAENGDPGIPENEDAPTMHVRCLDEPGDSTAWAAAIDREADERRRRYLAALPTYIEIGAAVGCLIRSCCRGWMAEDVTWGGLRRDLDPTAAAKLLDASAARALAEAVARPRTR